MKKIVLVLVMLLAAGSLRAASDNLPKGKMVKVDGQGTVMAEPDEATFTVEVRQEGASSKALVDSAKILMQSVMVKLTTFDIPSKDTQTAQYSVERKYQYANGESKPNGYVVTNRLKVILRKIDQVQDVLGALSGIDSVQVDGPQFGFSDPQQLQLDALKNAVKNARAKAEALAEAAGSSLGPVYSIEQTSESAPIVRPMAMMAKSAAATSVPIEKGTDEVTAQVEVIYTLK